MRRILALVGASVTALILALAASAATYPSPPFNFAHPGTPHSGNLSPTGGDNDRPMLVVFGQFNDVASTPNVDAASIATQFFGGGFGSVADFFRDSSFGKLNLTPAAEPSGTANDGVVTVDLGSYATFTANPPDADIYPSPLFHGDAIRGRKVIEAANTAGVDFAPFDRNNNGAITDDELIVFLVQEANSPAENCGGTRPIKTGPNIDGKSFPKSYSGGTTLTNTITHVHEVSHQALDHNDGSYASGRLDVSGPTCGLANTSFWDYNSWHKLHFGWTTPTVVAKDGYYDVGRWDTTGQSYLLYDPDKNTSNYFLVENRRPTAGTYDQTASDSGIVVWRIDDARWAMAPPNPYQLMRPNQEAADEDQHDGASDDAWDPSDLSTPNRTMSRTWSDGSASNVALRAIGPRGDTVRVYFDVRGPGILVDWIPGTVTDVRMLQANTVSFPVMNTGEASDTFAFTLTGLPSGWSATTQQQTLGAAATGTATVQLTVPGDISTGNYTLQAKGTSTTDSTVTSTTSITVRVLKRPTTLVYTGSTTGDYSDPAIVSAVLTDTLTGMPIAGKTIDFALGTQSTNPDPVTGSTGTAAGSITVTQASGSVSVVSSFAGDGTYLASGDSDGFTITKETLSFFYTGSTLVALGSTPTLSATATEEADGSAGDLALAGATFSLVPTLTVTPFSYSTSVSAAGAAGTLASGLPVDVWSVTVAVPSSNAYWEGSTAAASELVLFDPAAKFTGNAAGRDGANASISLTFDYQYDKSVRPRGSITLRYSGGTFRGGNPLWIVQVGSVAIIQTTGTVGTTTRSLRLRVDDNAEPPRPDTFRAQIGSYDSGTVTVTSGNLQSHPTSG
jgi:M6 family metalloprotease-like protein